MDGLNSAKRNQTAKVLERFFYIATDREYTSVIPDEDENYEKLPTLDEVKENADRVVAYAKEIILKATDYREMELNEGTLKRFVCNLDPLVDKILAINIADVLNKQRQYTDISQLQKIWFSSLEEMRADWIKDLEKEEEDTLLFPQISVGGIDTSKLEIGMTVKNYKVLCELLGQEVKDGKSKKYQLEDFSRYFDWEKSGQKFIITDIYDANGASHRSVLRSKTVAMRS